MTKRRIWIVSELFYPDEASTGYIMTNIAKSLSEDIEVHVICGPAGYDLLTDSTNDQKFNFKIHRIKTLNFNKNNLFGRLVRLIFLSLGMFFKGLFFIKRTDLVFIVTNPAFSIPLFSLLKTFKGFKYTILVHDVFPENLIPGGIFNSKKNISYVVLEKCFNWSYKKANKLIVLGRDMKEIMDKKVQYQGNISIIENWADLGSINPESFEENEIVIKNRLENKVVFLFAGNLGRLQGLDFLFDIIKEVKNTAVHFVFIGDGALLSALKEFVLVNSIKNVDFLGAFPRNKQNIFLNACHFGVVTLDQKLYGLGVPSKTYNIMAAGKPVFFIGNKKSEIPLMLSEYNCGISYDEGDRELILDFLNRISKEDFEIWNERGKNGRRASVLEYSKESILNKFKINLLHDK